MKKLTLILAALLSATSIYAQEPILAAVSQDVTGKVITVKNIPLQGSYTPTFKSDGKNTKVRNVILLIGDGMGLGAVASAYFANGGELSMTNLHISGFSQTQSADSFTTDSAASGSAYATGIKTNNESIGTDPNGKPAPNIPEKISGAGFVSGVISTDDVHGATPSAFFAHQVKRSMSAEIWGDIPASKLSFLSAGNWNVYKSQKEETREAIENKFKVAYNADEVSDADDKVLYVAESVKYDDRGNYLPETTQMAIDFLSKKKGKGFFLMVEGARIDKEAHGNNMEKMILETLDFDKAIEAALRFADKDGHTLVIITSDHETGGIALKSGQPGPRETSAVFTTTSHTPCMVPLFAYGPHSQIFTGMQQNSDVSNKIVELLIGK